MANVQIRNVPTRIHEQLKRKAAASGQSLSQYLLGELTSLAERPTMAEWLDRVRSRELYDLGDDVLDAIREGREERDEQLARARL